MDNAETDDNSTMKEIEDGELGDSSDDEADKKAQPNQTLDDLENSASEDEEYTAEMTDYLKANDDAKFAYNRFRSYIVEKFPIEVVRENYEALQVCRI